MQMLDCVKKKKQSKRAAKTSTIGSTWKLAIAAIMNGLLEYCTWIPTRLAAVKATVNYVPSYFVLI